MRILISTHLSAILFVVSCGFAYHPIAQAQTKIPARATPSNNAETKKAPASSSKASNPTLTGKQSASPVVASQQSNIIAVLDEDKLYEKYSAYQRIVSSIKKENGEKTDSLTETRNYLNSELRGYLGNVYYPDGPNAVYEMDNYNRNQRNISITERQIDDVDKSIEKSKKQLDDDLALVRDRYKPLVRDAVISFSKKRGFIIVFRKNAVLMNIKVTDITEDIISTLNG